mmetsp:Transcript_12867/g.32954  ORF Transcript_12867/g.32954 Transcript_12867/m.32954 type:complete len:230 (-) Transcript_12867:595-1284(-)
MVPWPRRERLAVVQSCGPHRARQDGGAVDKGSDGLEPSRGTPVGLPEQLGCRQCPKPSGGLLGQARKTELPHGELWGLAVRKAERHGEEAVQPVKGVEATGIQQRVIGGAQANDDRYPRVPQSSRDALAAAGGVLLLAEPPDHRPDTVCPHEHVGLGRAAAVKVNGDPIVPLVVRRDPASPHHAVGRHLVEQHLAEVLSWNSEVAALTASAGRLGSSIGGGSPIGGDLL